MASSACVGALSPRALGIGAARCEGAPRSGPPRSQVQPGPRRGKSADGHGGARLGAHMHPHLRSTSALFGLRLQFGREGYGAARQLAS